MKTNLRSDRLNGSRYFQGGDVVSTSDSIGWIEMKNFPKSPTDVTITLPSKYHQRPYLLAYDAYGKVWLDWFILLYNNISNELDGFVTGATIVLPTAARLETELLNKTVAENLNKAK